MTDRPKSNCGESTIIKQEPRECKYLEGMKCVAHNNTMCLNMLFSVRNGYQKPFCPDFTPKKKDNG